MDEKKLKKSLARARVIDLERTVAFACKKGIDYSLAEKAVTKLLRTDVINAALKEIEEEKIRYQTLYKETTEKLAVFMKKEGL